MSYVYLNVNPKNLSVGDCVIRGIALTTGMDWYKVHDDLCALSRVMADMPSSNRVWKQYLKSLGMVENQIENSCPNCLTVDKFCRDHPDGRYILSTAEFSKANHNVLVTGTHVLAVINGDYIDTWDSGIDVPLSYFYVGR